MKSKISVWLAATAGGLAILLMPAAAAAPQAISHGPRISHGASYSYNWSGYAVTPPSVSTSTFSAATGSWTQPAVTCPTNQAQYSSFWVGLDGYNSNSVEQIGTDSDCAGKNRPVYYAWYEFYPAGSVTLSSSAYPVAPGDQLSAAVTVNAGGTVTVALNNVSTRHSSWTYSNTVSVSGAAFSSAEWIAEAPSLGGRILPLANFGTVNFSGSYATMDGHTGSISDTNWADNQIDMVNSKGVVIAQTSALSSDGTAFSVSYVPASGGGGGGGSHHGHGGNH